MRDAQAIAGPWRLGPRGEQWFDRAIVGLLLLAVPALGFTIYTPVQTVLTVAEIVPLWWRRAHPLAVFTVVSVASATQAVLTGEPLWGQVAYPIALYSVARFSTARWGLAALGVGLVGAVVSSLRFLSAWDSLDPNSLTAYILTIGTIVVAAWALGTLGRVRSEYVAALVERNEQLRRDAAQQAALAAGAERARIAREMHDVVAHGLSVIVVQADGARYAAAQDPAAAHQALATISATGRAALVDMRNLLGLLRDADADTRPQPRFSDIATLVEEARAAGTTVTATLPAAGVGVPEAVGLTAYRIVQEGLSNVRKHAGQGASAAVIVTIGEALKIEVSDDGRGAAAAAAPAVLSGGAGHGLLGMAERVRVHGGELTTGPRPGGGFLVRARIPL